MLRLTEQTGELLERSITDRRVAVPLVCGISSTDQRLLLYQAK